MLWQQWPSIECDDLAQFDKPGKGIDDGGTIHDDGAQNRLLLISSLQWRFGSS